MTNRPGWLNGGASSPESSEAVCAVCGGGASGSECSSPTFTPSPSSGRGRPRSEHSPGRGSPQQKTAESHPHERRKRSGSSERVAATSRGEPKAGRGRKPSPGERRTTSGREARRRRSVERRWKDQGQGATGVAARTAERWQVEGQGQQERKPTLGVKGDKVGVSSKNGILHAATAVSRPPSKRGPLCAPFGNHTFEARPPDAQRFAASAVSRSAPVNWPPRDPSGDTGLVHGPGPPLAASAVSGSSAGGTFRSLAESATARMDSPPLAASAVSGELPAARPRASSDLAATPQARVETPVGLRLVLRGRVRGMT